MNIEKMREEFEAWHKNGVASFIAAGEIQAARHMQAFKETMLAVWEASRAALLIELPTVREYDDHWTGDVECFDKHEVAEAIEAAGVKWK